MFIVHIEHIKHTECIEHREVMQMALTGEARKARAAYLRQWRKKNPGKQKEYDQKKWPKNIQDKNIKYDALGKFVWMQEKSYMIDDYFPYGHGEKSVRLIERHMILPDDMAMAIRYHMGPWQESDKNNV